jgi:7,8-didemethyl-8-hydroxy-5-deazariboflavin synthase CofH subunit
MDLHVMALVADALRREQVGDVVTYVVNRNVNFTNVCVKRCGFCAFSRDHRDEEGYFLPTEEIVRRAREAAEMGATEVCVQAGLPPRMPGWLYVDLCRAIKQAVPDIHVHGFSPEEVLYGSRRARVSIREYLAALQDAGVGSLPGTSAEILDDSLRRRISPGRISVAKWREVITTAHALGIPTTCTIMYGHVETARQRASHLAFLRDLQRESGGFTEFVPLAFVHSEAPMYAKSLLPDIPAGPSGDGVVAMYAVSRLMLGRDIANLQVSWVKQGLQFSQHCLGAGANDLGGTLINESISTAAGAGHGQLVRPGELRRMIREAGRVPAERSTTYERLHLFETEPVEPDRLDRVDDQQARRFGSYQQLIKLETYRFNGS